MSESFPLGTAQDIAKKFGLEDNSKELLGVLETAEMEHDFALKHDWRAKTRVCRKLAERLRDVVELWEKLGDDRQYLIALAKSQYMAKAAEGESIFDSWLRDVLGMAETIGEQELRGGKASGVAPEERKRSDLRGLHVFANHVGRFWESMNRRFTHNNRDEFYSKAEEFLYECARCVDHTYTRANCKGAVRNFSKELDGS